MKSQKLGSDFEIITRDFFVWLFDKIDLRITKDRIQTSGTQDGFDVQIQISKNFISHNIYIECKNYSSGIDMGHIFQKALELETNYPLNNTNDLFIAINSKSIFKNKDNPEKTKHTLNNKFDFHIQLLDTSNGVREIFALNKHFYKEIYGEQPSFIIDEQKLLEKVKSLIFSNEPFKKVHLKESDKFSFLKEIEPTEYFIDRRFSKSRTNYEYFFESETVYNLEELVSNNKRVFILGNPGCGKTTSLKQFALKYWNTGEQNSSTPIFRNLKNFTITDTIEKKLPKQYEKIKNVLLILDGIDEIADIEDFISKLEDFLSSEYVKASQLKCVISCRTNIYESIVKNVSGFSAFFMKDLKPSESLNLLNKLCLNSLSSSDFEQIPDSFLNNPFQIEILATYINKFNGIPTNSAALWETYINERLKIDANGKQKKKKFKSSLIKRQSLKISLVNELMKKNTIDEDSLLEIFKGNDEHLEEFKKSPLLDITTDTKEWYFEHRNIQEYFASKQISKLSAQEMIKFIQISGKKRTHPSLFNSITFLINLLQKDSDKYKTLIEWLIDNEPEILFKADSNRITDDLKVKVFQTYFQRVCIEQTLWIDNNSTYSSNEISLFASCQANYDYLISIIENYKSHHRRTTLSALDLLKYFKIPFNQYEGLKQFLLKKLKTKNTHFDLSLKSMIIRVIYIQKLTVDDDAYLNKVFNCFKNSTHKEFNRSLMNLLLEKDDIEDFYEFIKEEFLLIYKLKERKVEDEVMRGGQYIINQLIFKIKDADKFLDIIKYYFTEDITIHISNEQELFNRIADRIIFNTQNDETFLIKLMSQITNDIRFHTHEKLLKKIITETNSNKQVIEFLLSSFPASKVRYFISSIVNQESIGVICKKLIELKTIDKEIEYWRNNIGNSSHRDLSVKFDNLMQKNGIVFKEPVFTQKKADNQVEKYKRNIQENFDLLFDKKKLKSKIRYLFTKHGKTIDGKKIRDIRRKWWDKNGHWNVIDVQIDVLDQIIFSRNKLSISFKEVSEFLKDDFVLFKKMKQTIEKYDSSNREYVISENQKQIITDWCITQTKAIDFNNVARASGPNSFFILNDYKRIETIFFFQNLFDIELPQAFLLECIKFYEFTKSHDSDEEYAKLKKLVNDENEFNSKIISNIKDGGLVAFSKYKHIKYAVENNLKSVFSEVRTYFKTEHSLYNHREILKQYIIITGDIDLLKECSKKIEEHITWDAINILVDLRKEAEFCIQTAKKYLKLNEDRYRVDALQTLFILNDESALLELIQLLKQGIVPSFGYIKFNNFNNVNDLNQLKILFDLIYKPKFDAFESHTYRNFFNYLITIFSVKEYSFETIQDILVLIKKDLSQKGTDLFYINRLIDDSIDNYINSKSSIYALDKALKTVDALV